MRAVSHSPSSESLTSSLIQNLSSKELFADWKKLDEGLFVSPGMDEEKAIEFMVRIDSLLGGRHCQLLVCHQDQVLHKVALRIDALQKITIPLPTELAELVEESSFVTPPSSPPIPLLEKHHIKEYNRRTLKLIPQKLIDKLTKLFKDAQKHLNTYLLASSQWDTNPAKTCVAGIYSSPIFDGGVANTKGDKRSYMEDFFVTTKLTIEYTNFLGHKVSLYIPLYAVFDGHGGVECARDMATYLPDHLTYHLANHLAAARDANDENLAIYNVLKKAMVLLGDRFREANPKKSCGTTATVALKIDQDLWVANLGDSRAVLCNNGKAIALSEDAKLEDPKYAKGVLKRGGDIYFNVNTLRVNGILAMARAAGHNELESGINPRTKIIRYNLDNINTDCYLVLGTDGLWDVVSSNMLATTVKQLSFLDCEDIAKHLVQRAFNAGSGDNITAMVLDLYQIMTGQRQLKHLD